MKNKLLLVLTFIIGFFFFSSPVAALTKINFAESTNGEINTSVHFEEGFVGGIDITFHITGDVSVQDFTFSDKINSGNYSKEYKYDPNQKNLTIRVTTGGIGTTHNLLNEKKELVLGTIHFTSSSKENVNYELSESAFTIVDNNWASQTIDQSSITLGNGGSFIYKVTSTESNTPSTDTTTEDNKTTESNGSYEESTNSETNNPSTPSGSINNGYGGNQNETKDPTNDTETTDSTQKENSSRALTVQEETSFPWVIIISVAVALGGAGLVYFLVSKKKKDK